MAKKIKTAFNGLKMILVEFHHIGLPPPPSNLTWAGQLNMGKTINKNATHKKHVVHTNVRSS